MPVMHRKKSLSDGDEYGELFVVVAYDIASDKRRNQIVNLLKNHGYRVNFSVFECRVKKKTFQKLKNDIGCLLDPKEDSVLYYSLCKSCLHHKEKTGIVQSEYFEKALFF